MSKFTILPILVFFITHSLWANFSPRTVVPASKGKFQKYQVDAIIRGGYALAKNSKISKIRWARKNGFERLVLEVILEGTKQTNRSPPYFQVALEPNKGKVNLGIRSIKNVLFSQKEVQRIAQSSGLIKSAYLAPMLQDKLVLLNLQMQVPVDVEAFYLVNPPRIVLDIRARKTTTPL